MKEAERLGFGRVILPKHSMSRLPKSYGGIKVVPVNTLGEAFKAIEKSE